MRHAGPARLHHQVSSLGRQFAQGAASPFGDALSEDLLTRAPTTACVSWIDRIFSPLVTLWASPSRVLSADRSCRAAVARLLAHRLARGQEPCSAKTGAYCQARQRLPEKSFSGVACSVGRAPDGKAEAGWLWKGRRVYPFGGTAVSMPDTAANRGAYPRVHNQKPGVGFPIARVAAIISLACGAILHLGACQYAGKGQGEVSLLRSLWDVLRPQGILLTDALLADWANVVVLRQRGVELVGRPNKAHRAADFRRGKRLGHEGHVVRWPKPTSVRPLGRQAYQSLPGPVTVREVKVRVTRPGFRAGAPVVVTTLLGPRQVTKGDLASLYRARRNDELDLRSIKSAMQMRDPRCKAPGSVREGPWAHVLAYNLIRTLMAQAAARHRVLPGSVSFKGAVQTLGAFQPRTEGRATPDGAGGLRLYHEPLRAAATHRVGDRPDRFEPRVKSIAATITAG